MHLFLSQLNQPNEVLIYSISVLKRNQWRSLTFFFGFSTISFKLFGCVFLVNISKTYFAKTAFTNGSQDLKVVKVDCGETINIHISVQYKTLMKYITVHYKIIFLFFSGTRTQISEKCLSNFGSHNEFSGVYKFQVPKRT